MTKPQFLGMFGGSPGLFSPSRDRVAYMVRAARSRGRFVRLSIPQRIRKGTYILGDCNLILFPAQ